MLDFITSAVTIAATGMVVLMTFFNSLIKTERAKAQMCVFISFAWLVNVIHDAGTQLLFFTLFEVVLAILFGIFALGHIRKAKENGE